MGHYVFRLPDIGEGVAEAEIVAWHVKPGDRLDEDQPMLDVMTDKATVEMTTPVAGRVTAVHGAVGERVPVGSSLVELEIGGAETLPEPPASGPPEKPRRPLAAPATRRKARELGVALADVAGTGPEGRVTPADLDAVAAGSATPAADGVTEVRIVGLRRRIAERMQEATRRIPHFGYVEEIDMTALEALRRDLNADYAGTRPKLTLLPFLMRALVAVLPDFPHLNARYDDAAGVLNVHGPVHIGIATQAEGGLMVPVVRHAETRGLWDLAAETARVAAAARAGKATPEMLSGSTITLTSLGPLGGIACMPVINHPEVAILAPSRLAERPVALGGRIVIRTMMNLSGAFDHRIVDGHEAARFVRGIKRLLEQPARLFIADGRP